ncbi:MAG TPA: flagellar basal body rod protein FlgB [Gammaproteobacteria bacterium]|nr:flagellar basal body rod protein FlgB [Gammaproteobacteria bacterium]
MGIDLDRVLGPNQRALALLNRRSEILAANLANADTPGYKARDVDFRALLDEAASSRQRLPLTVTRPGHLQPGGGDGQSGGLLYRVPHQPALDGNTVEAAEEQVRFSENAMRYLAEVRFASGKVRSIKQAIKGE